MQQYSEQCCCIYCFFIAPSESPTELVSSMIGKTSFLLTWRPPSPENQNGIIRHYVINVTVENTGMELQFTSVETQIALQFLHPYYNYTCVVAAVTVATGPSSTELTVTTLQDSECMKCRCMQP